MKRKILTKKELRSLEQRKLESVASDTEPLGEYAQEGDWLNGVPLIPGWHSAAFRAGCEEEWETAMRTKFGDEY